MKNKTILTEQAKTALRHAKTLAQHKNKKYINGDELFRGIYSFLRNIEIFDIFCHITGLHNIKALDQYYKQYYAIDFGHKLFEDTQDLPFNPKLQNQINKNYQNDNITKLDFMSLFYIVYSDLSSECNNYLITHNMDSKTTMENLKQLLHIPLIKELGIFAFLDIIHKLFSNMHLDIKKIKIMNISHLEEISDFNHLINSIESDIKERWDHDKKSWDNISTTKNKTKDNEKKKMTIEYFGTDLTKEYKEGFIDPIIWREKEIDQIIYTLLRKTKNNPLLIGEAWVGKTAIVEGLAQKIAQDQVPEKLKNKKIFMLDMWTLVAGTKYRWEFEARMKSILEEAMDITNNIILFIDELHTIIWAWGQENNDAAQMIKPLLARGKIKLIWATTYDEYQKHIEKDGALKRRFQEVKVDEPDTQTTIEILMGLKKTYEDFHGVKLSPESIKTAVNLSERYMLDRFLPDKAFDIIDEACARKSTLSQKLENDNDFKQNEKKLQKLNKEIEKAIEQQDYFKAAWLKEKQENIKKDMQKIRTHKNIPLHLRPEIIPEDIGDVLADKTGIPTNIVNESEVKKLQRLDQDLQKKILWQSEGVEAIVKTITRNRLSVVNKEKPIGSFLFLGPTGVGKTYLSKLIAQDYFGNKNALVRIDMSEYMEKFSVSKLIGSPAGYVGYEEWGQLTEAIRRNPYSVVLFDEIEKASPDILNILLQILDEGRLKDSKGRRVDFKSTIIIMTSNIWSEEFGKKKAHIWFQMENDQQETKKAFDQIKEKVLEEVKDFLSPELLNRIDHQIVFKPLSKEVMVQIFQKDLKEFLNIWKEKSHISLPNFSKQKITKIIDKIYNPQYGARPITRYIHDEIENELIKKVMEDTTNI